MKIVSISVLAQKPGASDGGLVSLASKSDTSSYSFFYRSQVEEFLKFLPNTIAERTNSGERKSVQEGGHTVHVYHRGPDKLCGIIVTDEEYPVRVAYSLLNKILDEFVAKVPPGVGGHFDPANPKLKPFQDTDLAEYMRKYQDPKQADTIMKVQQELDETKIELHKTIESVLERGEKLDNLVDRSNALSAQSKAFYKTAKKQNSCCTIM